MSFDTGSGGYTPPAPKKALSPWAWVGIGCGTLTVLGLGGCIVGGVMLKNAVESASKNATPEQTMAELKKSQIPIYEGAEFEPKVTKATSVASGAMAMISGGKIKMYVAAFNVPDPAPKVQAFYETKLGALGFSPMKEEFKNPGGRSVQQKQYSKGDEAVIVQTQAPVKPGSDGCVLALIKMTGVRKSKLQ